MRIKLAILEKDQSYLNRIVSVFNTKYADKIETYSFTDMNIALSTIESAKIDVFVVGGDFDIDFDKLPSKCGFAYFVESASVETLNNQKSICKFQKIELIYKQILSIYSEHAGNVSGYKMEDDSTKILLFSSPSGGAGTSTMAAASCLHFASKGKKVLHLCLEKYGFSDLFFSGEGQFDMSDIIFGLKSTKTNLQLKLESCVKQDARGVYFYSKSKIALDMLELSTEDVLKLLTELKIFGGYDYLVVDTDFGLDKDSLRLFAQAYSIVWIGDGSENSNNKITRAYKALTTMEQNAESPLTNRICLAYNKFSNKSSKTIGDIGIKDIGGAPRYEYASNKQIIEQLCNMEMFEKMNG